MNASVIVYGPQGCGKTVNAEALRRHYGLHQVVELDEPRRQVVAHGALLLTNDRGGAAIVSRDHGLRMVPFTHAARAAGVLS